MSESNDKETTEEDVDYDIMFEKIKHPEKWPAWGKKYIYESPNKGATVYAREFGKPHDERVLIKGEEQ
jgi:hypothetical protein